MITVLTIVWLLSGVSQNVRLEVSLVQGRVRTQFTAETLLSIMCLEVNLVSVSVRECLATLATQQRSVTRVKFQHMIFEISFTTTRCRAQLALEDRFLSGVNQLVSLETVALSESHLTDVTQVWLLSSVRAQVSLEFVSVWAGIGTVWTAVGSLSCV